MSAALPQLRMPYADRAQQRTADVIGMYVFLASEVMLFGGLFTVLLFQRTANPAAVIAASMRLDLWLGTLNTGLLLTSSLGAALAVVAARSGRRRSCALWLAGTATLGLAFCAVKAVEYGEDYADGLIPGLHGAVPGPGAVFMAIYLVATGLHLLHLMLGIALVGLLALRAHRGTLALPARAVTVELIALYWHLVDIVWIFLFPALYLARR